MRLREGDVVLDLYAAVDVDRCSLDTERAFSALVEVADAYGGIPRELIEHEYAKHKRAKRSFNVAGFIEQALRSMDTGRTWEVDILPHLIAKGHDRGLLMPYAEEFFGELQKLEVPHGLLTYGSWSNEVQDPGLDKERSIKWQLGKIAADPLLATLPAHVVDSPYKTYDIMKHSRRMIKGIGGVIELPDMLSVVPGATTYTRHLLLADDKAIAHEGGDSRLITGMLITPADTDNLTAHHVFDTEMLGQHVTHHKGMADATAALADTINKITFRY